MIAQSNILDFLAKAAPDLNVRAKTENQDNASFPKFKDILEKNLNKPAAFVNQSKTSVNTEKSAEVPGKNIENTPKVKCFRDIQRPCLKNTKKVNDNEMTGIKEDARIPGDETSEKGAVKQEDAVVNTLAKLTGMNPQELMQLLASANIKPEELTDESKVPDIAEKLSEVLNLSGEQKQLLEKIIGLIGQQVREKGSLLQENNAAVKEASGSKASNEQDSTWIKVEHPKIEVEVKSGVRIDLTALAAQFKGKIEEMLKKSNQNAAGFLDELAAKVDAALGEILESQNNPEAAESTTVPVSEASLTKKTEDNKPQDLQIKASGKEEAAVQGRDDTGNNGKENGLTDNKETGSAKTQQVAGQNATKDNEVQFSQVFANQTQKNPETAAVKAPKEVNIPKSEIINQVIEKAKVVVDGQKHEMVMELKPDSLGKLSLKVVTERGMVVAKFVAESQQVKEVLETNMQLLKDTLEKQGMSVQGFSVSVGQDSQGQYNRDSHPSENAGNRTSYPGMERTGASGIAGTLENQEKIRSYYWNDSKINLTA